MVSRETSPPLAATVEAARADLTRYADLLADAGVERGLIGPREVPRLWDRHLLNSAALGEVIGPGETVCDVGSGAGLPGIPLALTRPDLAVTLLEPLLRRATFLREAVEVLGIGDRVRVERGRAEDHRNTYDVVTARAVAPLDRLAQWCLPLVRPGGRLLALKGSSAADELAAAAATLENAGVRSATVVVCGADVVDPPATVVEILRPGSTGSRS